MNSGITKYLIGTVVGFFIPFVVGTGVVALIGLAWIAAHSGTFAIPLQDIVAFTRGVGTRTLLHIWPFLLLNAVVLSGILRPQIPLSRFPWWCGAVVGIAGFMIGIGIFAGWLFYDWNSSERLEALLIYLPLTFVSGGVAGSLIGRVYRILDRQNQDSGTVNP